MLLGGVVLGACYAVPTFLGRSAALGLGYGAATCWACFGMTKGDSPQVVKDVATYGGYLVAVVSAAALMRPLPSAGGRPPRGGAQARWVRLEARRRKRTVCHPLEMGRKEPRRPEDWRERGDATAATHKKSPRRRERAYSDGLGYDPSSSYRNDAADSSSDVSPSS